jgi:uncharacterized membrane protein YhaH (DUF805 family)
VNNILAQSIRPFLRLWDYRTRSTRTELIGFSLLAGFIGTAATLLVDSDFESQRRLVVALTLILLVPGLPLAVRRLHDSGRSGAFLVMGIPIWVTNIHDEVKRLRFGWSAVPGRPWWLDLTVFAASMTLLAFLLWNDDPLPNEYGPNPRYDDSTEAPPTQPAVHS